HDGEDRGLLEKLAGSDEVGGLVAGDALYRELPEKYRSRLVEVARLEFEAMARYRAGPYAGRAVLIKPTDARASRGPESSSASMIEELSARYVASPDNGWSPYIANLEVHLAPGDHITMMEGRGCKEIARIVSGRRAGGGDHNQGL
ncbi:MAG: hypothetical protein ACYC99_13245, partial [Candidatus Geothermincolia bacterium]